MSKVEKSAIVIVTIFFMATNFILLAISAQKLAVDDQFYELVAQSKQLEIDNKEIELKINELTTYDRIIAQANAAGMGPNQQNIRTVEE